MLEYYLTIKRNEVLTPETPQMFLKNPMLNYKSWTQKIIY